MRIQHPSSIRIHLPRPNFNSCSRRDVHPILSSFLFLFPISFLLLFNYSSSFHHNFFHKKIKNQPISGTRILRQRLRWKVEVFRERFRTYWHHAFHIVSSQFAYTPLDDSHDFQKVFSVKNEQWIRSTVLFSKHKVKYLRLSFAIVLHKIWMNQDPFLMWLKWTPNNHVRTNGSFDRNMLNDLPYRRESWNGRLGHTKIAVHRNCFNNLAIRC